MEKIDYRLALDLGANSLGWCVYRLDAHSEPDKIIRMGSRIFSDGRDPKTLASRAADRRQARQARRRRDRVLKRRHKLMQALIRFGLMPADAAERKRLQTLDPYALRERGLDQRLELHELGRALYHLARKRGFRSSRKDSRDDESAKESGKVKQAIGALRKRVVAAGCRTVGEYLAREHAERAPVRARRNSDGGYVLYLQRAMVEEEFDALWQAQQRHHANTLTDAVREELRDILLFQRHLKPVEAGRCPFEPTQYRARLCAPLQQRFRMLQELNHLRVRDGIDERALTLDERNAMLADLEMDAGPKPVSWARLAKAVGLRKADFNLGRDEKRQGLKGDAVGARFASDTALGDAWKQLSPDQQYALAVLVALADQVSTLHTALLALPAHSAASEEILKGIFAKEEREVVAAALQSLPLSLSDAQAHTIAGFTLPDDYGSLSLKALARIVPELEREVVTYDEAVRRAGYLSHSQFHTGEIFDRLPYYGQVLAGYTAPTPTAKDPDERRYGKIPNPTVHIGLNQVRLLVNALVKRYGPPKQIVIELTREFGASGEKRREIMAKQKENQDRNDGYAEALSKLGVRNSRENRLKLQLWDELGKDDAMDRYCIYSGKRLSKTMLFSDEVEIDHILPFSQTLHDGIGNKILCMRQANRDKGNRTPFDAWGHTERWAEIEVRAERLPAHKRKLFLEGALEAFLGDQDFLARHLTDTAYLGRAAKQYLTYVCNKDEVWVSSGKLTGMLRGHYGLPKLLWNDGAKNRNDHRHHALDAAVIGLCSRSLIQRMAKAAEAAERDGKNRLLERLELPWPGYRDELKACLDVIVVSHKPDRGVQTAMHKAGNYGLRGSTDDPAERLYCSHVPVDGLSYGNVAPPTGKPGRPSPKVRDRALREQLATLLEGKSDREAKQVLQAFSRDTGIRRVQLQQNFGTAIPIVSRRTGKPYRYVLPDENYCRDIVRRPDGKWESLLVNAFDANRRGFDPNAKVSTDGRPIVMRLRKGDMLAIEEDGHTQVMRIAMFTNEGVALAEHMEANTSERDAKHVGGFSYRRVLPEPLRKLKARLVGVDILGYVNDSGSKD